MCYLHFSAALIIILLALYFCVQSLLWCDDLMHYFVNSQFEKYQTASMVKPGLKVDAVTYLVH
jgi:hypothetical protein